MIVGTQGNQGTGKTALLTFLMKHYAEQGNRIYSNYWVQIPGIQVNYITTISELEKIHDGYVFLDEFWIWIDSRVSGFSDINAAVTGILMNLRKRRCSLFYESKRMHFSDRRIRELTDYVLEPHVYYDNDGSLEVIEQDMLYPIDLAQFLTELWVICKKYRIVSESKMIEVDNENDIIFKLSDVVNLYDTSEEIESLSKTEYIPGLQKGIKIEDHLEQYIKTVQPESRIAREEGSRGWDMIVNDYMCLSCISPRLRKEHTPVIDIRKKNILGSLKYTKEIKGKPYWVWNLRGKWYCRRMMSTDASKTQIPCVGELLESILNRKREGS